MREALQTLEKEGLIYRVPRGGFAVKGVTGEEVDEVFGLRGILEGYAGFLATGRIEEDESASLEEIIAREEACLESMNPEEFIRLTDELRRRPLAGGEEHPLHNLLMTCATLCTATGLSSCATRGNRSSPSMTIRRWLPRRSKNPGRVARLARKHMTRGTLSRRRSGGTRSRGYYSKA